jgi:2-polyprenyl-3-methyl-5-hydroxy-6-metoxy-1,4-benzoquinol methylase
MNKISKKIEKHFEQVKLNKYGFYELKKKPDDKELEKYYREKYFQENKGPYQSSYSEKELLLIQNKIEQKYFVINEIFSKKNIPLNNLKFLDIGCGEGWSMNFFKKRKWEVVGLEYSGFSCQNFNPDCVDDIILGDINKNIETLISRNRKFDIIWMTNVLEHVPDPESLLINARKLVSDRGILIVQIPNDFSELQIHLLENEFIDRPFWIAIPDHISYFSIDSLTNLMKSTGWEKEKIQTDFPIDWNLFNENTNYVKNKSVGKSVHYARIEIENFLHKLDPEKANRFYEVLAEMNFGRQIVGFFSVK